MKKKMLFTDARFVFPPSEERFCKAIVVETATGMPIETWAYHRGSATEAEARRRVEALDSSVYELRTQPISREDYKRLVSGTAGSPVARTV